MSTTTKSPSQDDKKKSSKPGDGSKKGQGGSGGGKGTKVGKEDFQIMSLLGKGAFGEVYLVKHKASGRYMALKQMDKSIIQAKQKTEHVKNEKRVLTQGRSPFLVRMHYSFQTDECLFLVMEYCPGGDLREFLKALEALDEEEAKLYFAEMIMAVHTLHQMGFIHRDLKPDNFLIDARGHLKLADFGLSKPSRVTTTEGTTTTLTTTTPSISEHEETKRRDRLSLLPPGVKKDRERLNSVDDVNKKFRRTITLKPPGTGTEMQSLVDTRNQRRPSIVTPITVSPSVRKQKAFSVVGTAGYMSPEVSAVLTEGKDSKGYDEVVDWWSLGCCFFEMVLGTPPFQGDSPEEIFEILKDYKKVIPTMFEQYREYLSPECYSLLKGFLCDPEERLGKDLKKLQSHPFFAGIDWNNLINLTPPFVPKDEMSEVVAKQEAMSNNNQ
eukprot:TRINITY_DN1374_c0_g1_i1.p1 TRINITY_DN1374_c0_g1~~TRINITY_DN1374_c0_g1_i1.p1  ORF type:complete len:439 (+),score=99.47 TRINITY_DN1374_c0_g1_i1:75-1391(+)